MGAKVHLPSCASPGPPQAGGQAGGFVSTRGGAPRSLPSCRPGEGLWPSPATAAQPPGLAFEAVRRRLCPIDPPKQHLYANAGCDPGGASWEPSQVSAMLLGRGPWACGVCPRGPQDWAAVRSRVLQPHSVRGDPSRLPGPTHLRTVPGQLCPAKSCLTLPDAHPSAHWLSRPPPRTVLQGHLVGPGALCPGARAGLWTGQAGVERRVPGPCPAPSLCSLGAGQQALLLSLMELASISRHWWGGCNRKLPSLAAIFSTAEQAEAQLTPEPRRLSPNPSSLHPSSALKPLGQAELPQSTHAVSSPRRSLTPKHAQESPWGRELKVGAPRLGGPWNWDLRGAVAQWTPE